MSTTTTTPATSTSTAPPICGTGAAAVRAYDRAYSRARSCAGFRDLWELVRRAEELNSLVDRFKGKHTSTCTCPLCSFMERYAGESAASWWRDQLTLLSVTLEVAGGGLVNDVPAYIAEPGAE